MHERHLRITLSAVPRARTLHRLAYFHKNDVRDDVTGAFIKTGIDLAHVMLLGTISQREEAQRLRVLVRVRA